MPIYEYVCKSCGAKCDLDRLPREGAKMRHLVEGKVCGTFRRDWSSVNVNRVPGGGRG
jgi:predicted nucleic acid-binding Zn ribbon protein